MKMNPLLDRLAKKAKKAIQKWNDHKKVEEIKDRIQFAKILVSVWSHACLADGVLTPQEDDTAHNLISHLFDHDALFPTQLIFNSGYTKNEVHSQLINTFANPIPINQLKHFGKEYTANVDEFVQHLYVDACKIVSADGAFDPPERVFLDDLADHLHISKELQIQLEHEVME